MNRRSVPVALLLAPALGFALTALSIAAPLSESKDPRSPRTERQIAEREGEFELLSTFWPAPGAEPIVTRQRARRSLILNGRVLRLDVVPLAADFDDLRPGQALPATGFFGTGLEGYDESTGESWYVWTDTSATGVAVLTGRSSSDGGTYRGTTPTASGPKALRVEVRRDGRKEIHTYHLGEGESAHEMLELRYVPLR